MIERIQSRRDSMESETLMDLRCESGKLHGRLDLEMKTLETSCDKKNCGKEPGVTVLHTFDAESGRLLSTRRFRDIIQPQKGT